MYLFFVKWIFFLKKLLYYVGFACRFTAQNTFIGGFPNELPIYHSYHQSLSQNEFKMDLGLVASAKLFLRKVARDTGASVFVGMHVRRTDYAVWLKAKVNGRLLSKRVSLKSQKITFLNS